jgi:hypothetical protein
VKARLIASAAVLAVVLGIFLLREPAPGASARPSDEAPPRHPPAPAAPAARESPWPARDPFRYVEVRREPLAAVVARPSSAPVPSGPPATPNPLRLVGLVRRAGVLKAAVSMWGETVVLGPGEESRGYKVLSIDDEGSVRLKAPDGAELTLLPSAF